jgi:hypothetical protein
VGGRLRHGCAALLFALASCVEPAERIVSTTDRVIIDRSKKVDADASPVVHSPPPVTMPPPISGGTLLAMQDERTLVAADPDNDCVWLADLGAPGQFTQVGLQPGDNPWRSVEDAQHRVHVVLRGAGAVATIDPTTKPLEVTRRTVCAEPRGIAFDAMGDRLLVVCADGALLSLPPSSGEPQLVKQLDDDLRDVALWNGEIVVTRFRSAKLITIYPDMTTDTQSLPDQMSVAGDTMVASVAWRAVPSSQGLIIVHQGASRETISLSRNDAGLETADAGSGGPAYGGAGCAGNVVQSFVTRVDPNGFVTTLPVPGTLPVDVAVDSSTGALMTVSAGDHTITFTGFSTTFVDAGCGGVGTPIDVPAGQPIAVAIANGQYVVQLREPPGLMINGEFVERFPIPWVGNSGQRLFHAAAPARIACASCHPEGRDDGHVWSFSPGGLRRTQSLAGGVLETAPFHWDGAFSDFQALVTDVLVGRMGAASPSNDERTDLQQWVESIPRPSVRPPADPAAASRGQALFEDLNVGCTQCHVGPHMTNNLNENVGTGASFQVPALLGVAARAPYMHDGCALSLADRFGPCGGGDAHGRTSQLSQQNVSDLVAFLTSL